MAQQMTFPAHARAILVLGLPLIGSQLAQFLIHVTDTVMMGWYGVTDLAAVVVAGSVLFTVIIVGSGFAWATVPLVAAAVEEGDEVQVRRVTRMGLWASGLFAAVVMPVLLGWGTLFEDLGQTPEVARLASAYMGVAAWSLVPALVIMCLRGYLSALERTQIVLWATLAGAVVNAGLNYMLIFGNFGMPELGGRGAALASVATNIFVAGFLAIYAAWRVPEHAIFVRLWRSDPVALRQVFRLGWPIGLTSLAEGGLFAASAIMVGWVGTVPLAAHGIALQLTTATFMVHIGLSQAATIRAGRAYGRKDTEHLRRGGAMAIGLSLAMSCLTIAVFLIFPEPLVLLFLDPGEADLGAIVGMGIVLLAVAALFQLADGAQVLALGLLRGVQDTRVPMVYAVVSYWAVGAPVAYLLGFRLGFGAVGVWLGLVVGLVCAGVLMLHRFWFRVLPRLEAGRL